MVRRPKSPSSNRAASGWLTRALACVLLLAPAPPASPEILNYRDEDIRLIIESVGEITGTNFLIDNRVRGKVTLISQDDVPEEALYDVLLSILRMHNLRAVEGENFTRILPANVAPRYKPEFLEDAPRGESEKLVTTIVQIRHLNAASIIPMIKPLMSAQAQVLVHKESNNLLITEINSNLSRVNRVIDKIDVADVGDFEILDLDYADAKDIVGLVQRASNKNLRHLVQVVADRNGNRIILSGPSKVRRGLRALIAELDSETSTDASGRIKVIRLHYARAEDVITIVKGLLSSAEFIKTLGGDGEYEQAQAQKTTAAKKGDKKKDTKAKQPEKKEEKKKTTSGKRNYVIEVDKALNALIVGGPPKVISAVERVVREIDVPRPQVLIEAIFADTSEEKRLELRSRFAGGKEGLGGVADGADARGVGATFITDTFSIGARALVDGNILQWILRVLKTDEDSRVLSTPSVLTLNNEEAMIDVSDELSIETGVVTDGGGGNTRSFDRRKFGTKLVVTPQITEGDSVRLDIEYKTEDVGDRETTGSAGDVRPDTKSREIKTTVLVNDGDILVLGGLSNESATEGQRRVPILSSVPVLGHLFRDRSSARNKTTLMVFIRPTILRNADDGSETSRERYAALRLEQLLDAQDIETLMPAEDPMVLPELRGPRAGEGRKLKRKKKLIKRKKRRRDDG